MGVGITYTGVDGKVSSFNATSPSMAMDRLSSIQGFNRNQSDEVAEAVASGWKKRTQRKLAKKNQQDNYLTTSSLGAKKESYVKDINIKGGHTIKTMQDGLRLADGSFIKTGVRSVCLFDNDTYEASHLSNGESDA